MSVGLLPSQVTNYNLGALVLLSEKIASASASLDFTSIITSAYDEYLIELINIVPASNSRVRFLVSTDNGSTWATANVYRWTAQKLITGVSSAQINGGAATSWDLDTGDITLQAGGTHTGKLHLIRGSAAASPIMYANYSYDDNVNGFTAFEWSGTWRGAALINAIQFKMASGNITSGTIRVYGIAKASTTIGNVPAVALIESQILGSDTATVTFSSIPQIYRNLEVRYVARSSVAATADNMLMRLNGDSGANYDRQLGLVSNATFVGQEAIAGTSANVGNISGNSATAGLCGAGKININSYRQTIFNKMIFSENGYEDANASGGIKAMFLAQQWRSTAAITSVALFTAASNFKAGSQFDLYGYL